MTDDVTAAQAQRIERLIGDKRRIHGLLQGAWSLMDPASDPVLHEEIVRELDAGCETGRCTDACEAEREAQAQEIARLTGERDEALAAMNADMADVVLAKRVAESEIARFRQTDADSERWEKLARERGRQLDVAEQEIARLTERDAEMAAQLVDLMDRCTTAEAALKAECQRALGEANLAIDAEMQETAVASPLSPVERCIVRQCKAAIGRLREG